MYSKNDTGNIVLIMLEIKKWVKKFAGNLFIRSFANNK